MLEAKEQGHRRKCSPKNKKERTDPLETKNRNARGQGPRTQVQVFSKKKKEKKGLQKFFEERQKKIFEDLFFLFFFWRSSKNFSGDLQNFNDSKNSAVLEPRTGQFSRI